MNIVWYKYNDYNEEACGTIILEIMWYLTKPKPETTLQGTKALESGLSEMKFGAQEFHTRA